jgi:hypothetical protein
LIVIVDYPNLNVTEGSTSDTRRVREAGHASHRRERSRRMQEEGGLRPRRRGGRGRHADVEPDVEHQQYMEQEQEQADADVELQHMEEQELEEELQGMDQEMEDAEPQQRRKKKEKVVDPEPLQDYPGGPHQTDLLWRYHVHVARKAADGVVCTVKLTLYMIYIWNCLFMYCLNSLY